MLAKLSRSKNSLLQLAVDAANNSKADQVLLVLGHLSSRVAASLNLGRAEIVYNKNYKNGLSTSIRSALTELPEDYKGALLMVADQPMVSSKILNGLVNKFKRSKSQKIVAMAYKGEPRNPVIIPRSLFPEIFSLRGDVGANKIVRGHLGEAKLVNVKDPKIFLDIDRKSDLERL
jgi:molybdenum cofactor cytidylyltransferase